MPFHCELDRESQVLCTAFDGSFTFGDFLASGEETRRHITDKITAVIWDYTEVTSFDVSTAEIRQMAAMPSPYPAGIPSIAVAPTDYVYGMFRMFQILSEATRPHLGVVRTREDAYRMLGIARMNFDRV